MLPLVVLNISYILDLNLQPLFSQSDKDTYNIIKERKKREEDEVICRGHILNTLFILFFSSLHIYQVSKRNMKRIGTQQHDKKLGMNNF